MQLDALTVLALLLGLGMFSRITAVLWPAQIKKIMKTQTEKITDNQTKTIGVALISVGLICAYFVLDKTPITQIAATLFSFSLLAGGVLLLIPRLARAFWKEDIESKDTNMRLLAGTTTLLGIAVLYAILKS